MKLAVLASGRGSNLQALIDEWKRGMLPVEFMGVGSDKIDALALVRAEQAGIPARVFAAEDFPDKQSQENEILNWLEELGIELLVLAGYMRVLSKDFIRKANFSIVNIHPSLLPSFPGMHAQRQALEYGVKVTGCTVHFVDEGLDSGPIILQQAVPVFEEDDEDILSRRVLKVEHEIYPEAIRLISQEMVRIEGRKVAIFRQ